MDYRFRSAIREFLVSLDLKDNYDMVSLAGASKDLVENDANGAAMIVKEIGISHRLHCVTDLYLIHHMDCGAYGGHAAFPSLQAEREKQNADMEQARKLIEQKFQGVRVHKILARIEEIGGKNKIDFEVLP